ncbi:glycosyltransferase [Nostoc linckia FACHB-104]|nr:glycosyltransferase [Nostoc linckia FACHB-104]
MMNTQAINNVQAAPILNDNPLVSIIIGNYNYERFIKEAIDSALNQKYQNIEVIVVDDGSQDKSREIITSYGDRVIPVFKENSGLSSCHNAGFAVSRGDIICFLDSDDIFVPHKIAEIVKIFDSSEEVDWCFNNLQLINADSHPLDIAATPNYLSGNYDFRGRIQSGKIPPYIPPTSALCFRRSLLEKILPIPTSQKVPANDYYVKFMAVALGQGFMLAEKLTQQRIHDSNALTLRPDKLHMKARDYLFTGFWVKQKFPHLSKFANTLLAVGKMFNWKAGNKDSENLKVINKYLENISISEKLRIYLQATYYYLHSIILAS